jgi:hypothetical protein
MINYENGLYAGEPTVPPATPSLYIGDDFEFIVIF